MQNFSTVMQTKMFLLKVFNSISDVFTSTLKYKVYSKPSWSQVLLIIAALDKLEVVSSDMMTDFKNTKEKITLASSCEVETINKVFWIIDFVIIAELIPTFCIRYLISFLCCL